MSWDKEGGRESRQSAGQSGGKSTGQVGSQLVRWTARLSNGQ